MTSTPLVAWPLSGAPLLPQIEALSACRGRSGWAYFMDPGMGKTGVVLAETAILLGLNKLDRVLVICPNTLRFNWQKEAIKFSYPYPVHVAPDTPPDRGMWVINYEKLITGMYASIVQWVKGGTTYIVCDESHRIKTPKAKSTKQAIKLFDMAKYKRVMTGTAMANSVMDLWPQIRSIGHHGVHKTPYTWRNRYGVMGGYMGKKVIGMQNVEEMQGILYQCSFIAKKDDWLKYLPPKAYYSVNYEMSKEQRTAHDKVYRDRFLVLEGDEEVNATMVITALMKMQQAASGFMISDSGETTDLVDPNKNPKMLAVKEIIDETEGKLIVFAHYKYTLDLLEKTSSVKHVTLRGGMKPEDIKEIERQFNEEDDVKVLYAQISVAKEGLTLLGTKNKPCSTTIYVENTYSLIDRTQSEDRNHRHGQVGDQVSYYDLVGSWIEEKTTTALQTKKSLVDAVITGVKTDGRQV